MTLAADKDGASRSRGHDKGSLAKKFLFKDNALWRDRCHEDGVKQGA
jgi:hypothetical protein